MYFEKRVGSTKNESVLLVNEILVETPCYYAACALAHYSGEEPAEVAHHAVRLVDFYEGVCDAAVVLRLVFVVILEVHSRTY